MSLDKEISNLRHETDALDQSVALNRITMQLLKDRAADCRRLWIALILSILVNFALVAGFLWYESQWEYSTVETTTTTVEQTAGDTDSNNIYQSGENAIYSEGGGN